MVGRPIGRFIRPCARVTIGDGPQPRYPTTPHMETPREPPQTQLLAVDPPSPYDIGDPTHLTPNRFDQRLPGDDGTWSAGA